MPVPVPATMLGRVAAMDPVAATIAQPTQLLGIHVDQLAGVGALIAADQLPGRPVHPGQPVAPVAAEHPVDGGGWQPDQWGDPGRPQLAGLAQLQDRSFQPQWGPPRMGMGAAGPVDQAGLAVLAKAGPPAVGGGARGAHLGRDVRDRAASRDALAQDHPSGRGQPGVSVGHEDLQRVSRQTAPPRRRSSPHVNNPHAQYS
jgi:hypothetical protein